MNVLDENILENQRQLLRGWRIRTYQVGHEVGRNGMTDQEIIPLLHQIRKSTFFTRDRDFYERSLCHRDYCLVYLSVTEDQAAHFIHGFLRHSKFNTRAKRMGAVVRVSPVGLQWWRSSNETEEELRWSGSTP